MGGLFCCYVFFFKQKTAYDMRISDWISDVCSSDLRAVAAMRLPSGPDIAATYRLIDWASIGFLAAVAAAFAARAVRLAIERRSRDATVRYEIGRAPCRDRVCQFE